MFQSKTKAFANPFYGFDDMRTENAEQKDNFAAEITINFF